VRLTAEIAGHLRDLASSLGVEVSEARVELPRQGAFGDFASNLPMVIAARLGRKPIEVAEEIARRYPTSSEGVGAVEAAPPGFLNFHLAPGWFHNLLREILVSPGEYGASREGAGRRWNFEFVSANPTGPLNVVSARAASVGDALIRIFRRRGFDAVSEYYFNDAGRQVRLLGASVLARSDQIRSGIAEVVIPEDGYHGEYVLDIARAWQEAQHEAAYENDESVGGWATNWMLERQRTQLNRFRVGFDVWFREASLHTDGRVEDVVRKMKEVDQAYEREGALWFRASAFGDTDDRVMVTSEGRATYRVPDMAYHLDKFGRGFEKAVVLLGPDHHGAIITLQAALKALGLPDSFYEGIIVQQVNLLRDGEPVKMSKRAGQLVTLDELVDEVGVDAARFFFLRRKISTPLDFDIELAKRHSDENPVYYVQYAHARICSILRQPGADALNGTPAKYLNLLQEKEELDVLRSLMLFDWTLEAVVRSLEPSLMTTYLIDVAKAFHYFYTKHRVLTDDRERSSARLALCRGTAAVLKEGLELIGVEAPERM